MSTSTIFLFQFFNQENFKTFHIAVMLHQSEEQLFRDGQNHQRENGENANPNPTVLHTIHQATATSESKIKKSSSLARHCLDSCEFLHSCQDPLCWRGEALQRRKVRFACVLRGTTGREGLSSVLRVLLLTCLAERCGVSSVHTASPSQSH